MITLHVSRLLVRLLPRPLNRPCRGFGLTRPRRLWLAATATLLAFPLPFARAQSLESLGQLSIEELGDVEITSVSKRPETLADAASSIYVISHDDVMRSGATTLPEILRLAPNLQVDQLSPSNYIITARGFSGNTDDQNFSNKLLVLIDGRSVYTPLYSGVYWDMQDVLPDDIDHIEVISGPGATLWGANAMNGVINITTRTSGDTQGGVLTLGGGNLQQDASLQYGGRVADDLSYRVYAKAFSQDAYDTPSGSSAHDGWSKPQGGFRLDWTPSEDAVSVSGDLYAGAEQQDEAPDQLISGANLTAHWTHTQPDGSSLQLLAYYDQTRRSTSNGDGAFVLHTYDIEAQYSFQLGDWNNIVWGLGDRASRYAIDGRISPYTSLLFAPAAQTLNLADGFVEDEIALADVLRLTIGLKLEDDPYSGLSPMPSGRLSWKLDPGNMLWAAISRAIRSPTPFDRDVIEKLGSIDYIVGGADFQPEQLTAYEVGYRGQLGKQGSLSVSLFADDYDDLKSIETTPGTFLPLYWGNMVQGTVLGVELWGSYRLAEWWALSPGLTVQHENLSFKPGASQILGTEQEGDDPHVRASVRSSMNLSETVTFDADLRYVGALPDPHVPDYAELNARLAWAISPIWDVSLSGFNLLHPEHQEFIIASSDEVKRSFYLESRWKF